MIDEISKIVLSLFVAAASVQAFRIHRQNQRILTKLYYLEKLCRER